MKEQEKLSRAALNREQILSALRALSNELGKQSITGEICLFGGTVMILAFTARLTTKDVDALFQPARIIRDLARQIAEDQDLPSNWLNDSVKAFVSARHQTIAGNLPQFPHLRLTMPVPEYLLAMKCMATANRRHSHRILRCCGYRFSYPASEIEIGEGGFGYCGPVLPGESHSG